MRYLLFLTHLLLFLGVFQKANAQKNSLSLNEIMLKYCEAQGGLEYILSVNSVRLEGTIKAQESLIHFIQIKKQPNYTRLVISQKEQAVVWGYNGNVAWQKSPTQEKAHRLNKDYASDFIKEAPIFSPLIYAAIDENAGITYEGEVNVENRETYELKLDDKAGNSVHYFIDKETFLEVKILVRKKIHETVILHETYFEDYRQMGKLMIPFSIETYFDKMPDSVTLITEFAVNAGIFDSYFEPPNTIE